MEPLAAQVTTTDGPDSVAPAAPPFTYIGVAENLLPGVRALADAPSIRGVPLAFLSAHVLECLLKAFLSKAIGPNKPLKADHNIRHNLSALWSDAKSKGLALPDPPPSWVDCLSSLHNRPFYLRYAENIHVIVTPAAEPMATEVERLLDVVKSAVC